MDTYLLLYFAAGYCFLVIAYSIYNIHCSSKLLPESIKQKYKYNLRAKAMFISATRWKQEFEENDIPYFISYNKKYRNYLLNIFLSLIVFNVIFVSIIYLTF